MYEDLEKQAIENLKKERVKKRGVYIVGAIFTAVAIILFAISSNFNSVAAYWIRFPILVLALVYAIIYFSAFGIPFISDDEELSDEEVEREIVKIYRRRSIKNTDPSLSDDSLELKEIEALKNKWDDEEFV